MYIVKVDSSRDAYKTATIELSYENLETILKVFDRLEDSDLLFDQENALRYELKCVFDLLRYGKVQETTVKSLYGIGDTNNETR